MSDGHWTYARNLAPDPKPGEFLFDRSVDPGENVNLIEREPEQALRMRQLLDAHLQAKPLPGVLCPTSASTRRSPSGCGRWAICSSGARVR